MSNSINFSPEAVHLAFSTYPLGQYDEYLEYVKSIYKKNHPRYFNDKIDKNYYNPRIYRLFGHYDVLCVTIIDSYRFALRVYDNNESQFIPFRNITYQIQTGTPRIFFPEEKTLNNVLLNNKLPYINVCSLKLNNGLLIGSGAFFLKLVLHKINDIIKSLCTIDSFKINFCILNSYNWADITLLLLGEDPNFLATIVTRLREIILSDLEKIDQEAYNYILNNCLYHKLNLMEKDQRNFHCFVESQSILGIDIDADKKINLAFDHNKFKGQIEWDIKPGHFAGLAKELNLENELLKLSSFKNGKTDMVTSIQRKDSESDSVSSNAADIILRKLREEEQTISFHIRKTKTVPLFTINSGDKPAPMTVHQQVNKLSEFKIEEVDLVLTAATNLNLSRQLKFKIEKIFFNYNNSITDSISYIYLIDFKPFLDFLKTDILNESRIKNKYLSGKIPYWDERIKQFSKFSIRDFEDRYEKIVNAFEEAYLDRSLNSYNYEDLNDFNIDFNVNTTQILSTYDSLIKMISPLLFDLEKKMLVRQNELNTVSNIVSINYNVFHLFEPPLIFNTIVKEICNQFFENLDRNDDFGDKFPKEIEFIKKARELIRNEFNETYNDFSARMDMDKLMNEFDLLYFQTDILKYFFTFNANTELYVFWSWLYYIQNTSLHSTTGHFIELNFNKELIRILLIISTFHPGYLNKLECPVPDLSNLWYNNFVKFRRIITKVSELKSFKLLVKYILSLYKDHTQVMEYPVARESSLVTQMYDKVISGNEKYVELATLFNDDHSFTQKYSEFLHNNKNTGQFLCRWKLLEVCYIEWNELFEVGIPKIFSNKDSTNSMYFNCLSYMTLRWYFEKMNKTIKILPDGYLDENRKIRYGDNNDVFAYVDMKGGIFYPHQNSQEAAMRFNHAVFHALWHLGLSEKINLFNIVPHV